MEKRSFLLSYEEHVCTIDGLKGTLKTTNVEERLPDGKLKVVHLDIHFTSHEKASGYQNLLKLFKLPTSLEERKGA